VEMAEPRFVDEPAPTPPLAPTSRDCCRAGCEPCVFELYDRELARYEAALRQWRARHGADPP